MAIALQDAGFQEVEVDFHGFSLDGSEYLLDDELVKWQQDAIVGWGVIPIRMKLDPQEGRAEFVEYLLPVAQGEMVTHSGRSRSGILDGSFHFQWLQFRKKSTF